MAGDNDGGDNIDIIMVRGDVTVRPVRLLRGSGVRAIAPIQVMKYTRYAAKTRVKARAALMDVKTNYESGR